MNVKSILVTPEIAHDWLLKSKGNPRWKTGKFVDNKRVAKIAQDIIDNKWFPGNNSIAFDSDGVLVDGHHRLSAIVKSGKPVESIVVFGLEDSSLKHIDENRGRTYSQRLGLSPNVVAVVNCHFWMKNGVSQQNPTVEEVSSFVNNHPFIFDAVSLSCFGTRHPVAKKAGVAHGLFCALEYGVSIDTIQSFTKCVNTGFVSSPSESAAIVLRNMLLRLTVKTRTDSLTIDYAAQSSLFDYIECIPRKNAYHSNSGYYFNKLYG